MTTHQVLAALEAMADPEIVAFKKKKYGIEAHNALGIYHKELKALAKTLPKDNTLAVALFDTNIYEARLLCSKLFNPKDLTEALMETWVQTFENWEICDSFSMAIFARSEFAVSKAIAWSDRTAEFEKRSAFAIMAAYCMADKFADNSVYESFLPIIKREANDDRIYVKKAVNWALRSIGKRNIDLNKKAIACAQDLLKNETKAARWIATNALKELEKPEVRISDYPRKIYRK